MGTYCAQPMCTPAVDNRSGAWGKVSAALLSQYFSQPAKPSASATRQPPAQPSAASFLAAVIQPSVHAADTLAHPSSRCSLCAKHVTVVHRATTIITCPHSLPLHIHFATLPTSPELSCSSLVRRSRTTCNFAPAGAPRLLRGSAPARTGEEFQHTRHCNRRLPAAGDHLR